MSATWGSSTAGSPAGRALPGPGRARAGSSASPHDLAASQSALVAALVAGGPLPPGFDPVRIDATRLALLRKRAGEAAKAWPLLAASLGDGWAPTFTRHRDGHEPVGALRDGWDVARALRARGELGGGAARELDDRERALRYDGTGAPCPRLRARIAGLLRRR